MEGRHLYGLMAVDAPLDLARGCIGVSLLVITLGRTDRERRDRWIVAAGILLLMVAVSGLVDRQLFGLVPSSFTPVDLLVTTALGVLLLRAGVGGNRRTADQEDPTEAG
jgi:predicted transporter